MSLPPGTRLGPYEVLAPLGAGGMGEVYRARDTRLDRIVAIKVLPSELSSSPEARQRFEREARAVSSLNHPHICVLHDVGRHEGTDYLVMELLEGETLLSRLQQGPLPAEQAVRYAIQIADALDKAHRQGVIHRDLKPGNIMLTKTGAKLLDFGLAKNAGVAPAAGLTVSPTMSKPLTAEGSILGTFQYMAPEQLEGREADARSDIFAFGAVLYEMATGQRPFQGRSQASVIAAILHLDPPSMATLQPLAPLALERLVQRCLAKDPDERWQTARDLAFELEGIGQASGVTASPASAPAAARRHHRWAWLLAVTLLGAAAAGFGIAWYRAASVEPRAIRAFILPPDKTTFRSLGIDAGPVAVSPDGSRLVFSAEKASGAAALCVRPVDSVVSTELTGTDNGAYPFWSPDGKSIGFFADGKLRRIDASGGPALTLCDAPAARGGAWGPDGTILFAPSQGSGLSRVPSTGGAAVEVTSLDRAARQETHRWPQFLPGGRRFLYFSRVASGDEGNAVMMGSLDGGDAQLVVRSQANAAYASGYLLFIRDTTLMAQRFDPDHASLKGEAFPIAQQIQYDVAFSFAVFAVSETGVLAYRTGDGLSPSHLVWFDRSGKQMGLLGEKVAHTEFSLSPDLRSIAASVLDPRVGPADLWIYDVARGLPTRFTFEPAPDTNPVWSPDGSRVAFRSRRTGSFDLYVKSFAGSENENVLLGADYDEIPESWSPDGRHLAYVVRGPATGPDIWILPLAGDSTPIPYVQTSFRDRDPAFSPDGRWIAYVSDESRRDEIYVAPFPGPGRKWQISKGGGVRPRWRGDGREIYYAAADNTITAVEVDQRGTTFEIGSAKPLFSIPPQRFGSIFRATPDGQRFLVNVPIDEERPMPLTLVVNWTADLQR